MIKSTALINGIGNTKTTKRYYDNWSEYYDKTLKEWNYTVPKKCIKLLKNKLRFHPKKILDLACGTGLFGEELVKVYKESDIYGSDLSSKSLLIAKDKNIYKSLINNNFEIRFKFKLKFELVSIIGAMTYCKNFDKLFSNIKFYLSKRGYLIFSHRIDLWKKQNFDEILFDYRNDFKIIFISRANNYLPQNKDFKNKIKVRLVLLQKI